MASNTTTSAKLLKPPGHNDQQHQQQTSNRPDLVTIHETGRSNGPIQAKASTLPVPSDKEALRSLQRTLETQQQLLIKLSDAIIALELKVSTLKRSSIVNGADADDNNDHQHQRRSTFSAPTVSGSCDPSSMSYDQTQCEITSIRRGSEKEQPSKLPTSSASTSAWSPTSVASCQTDPNTDNDVTEDAIPPSATATVRKGKRNKNSLTNRPHAKKPQEVIRNVIFKQAQYIFQSTLIQFLKFLYVRRLRKTAVRILTYCIIKLRGGWGHLTWENAGLAAEKSLDNVVIRGGREIASQFWWLVVYVLESGLAVLE
jgi:hypothetical protein